MTDLLTPQNAAFAIGFIGTLFAIYQYFRTPQIEADKKESLLSQQLQWQSESNDRRFKEMQDNFTTLVLQSNNHIHTVDTKVDALTANFNVMSNEITKLSTIIDERIPKK